MSHTVMIILGGLVLLAIMVALGRPDRAQAARRFLPVWAAISIANLLVGVLSAGYGWAEEAGVLTIVFGAPAIAALAAARLLKA